MTALDLYDADTPSFSVNKDFAAKFELKKRTEELSKCILLFLWSCSSSVSTDEG
jgi:hypothetical protein